MLKMVTNSMIIFIFKSQYRNCITYHNNPALKLNNPATSAKACWYVLKNFYNGEKIPVIPPLLINNKLV